MKNFSIFILFLLLVFSSCRKDIEEITITEHTPGPTIIEGYEAEVQMINSSVIGFVVDENQEPIIDALVKLGDLTTNTDDFGHFFFNNIQMNALGTFVTIEKEGYFNGSRRFFPIADTKNRVKIELIRKIFNQNFLTVEGGLYAVAGGASVNFEPFSIQKEDGTLYDGVVSIAMNWLNPDDLRTYDQMPGNLQGVGMSTLNEEVALATYGMMAVELQGESGEKLNIAEGFTATITMPVPESLQANAPDEIILWAFNEEVGIWHEQSIAYLQGNEYVGEVSHFSFWNCDVPLDAIYLTLTLRDENSLGVSNLRVVLRAAGVGCAVGYTNQNGEVSGLVPQGRMLTMEVYDVCGNLLLSEQIGSFDNDAAVFIFPVPNVNNTTITGSLECSGTAINNGLIKISFDGHTEYFYLDDTNFDFTITTCMTTTEIEVVGINLEDLTQSEVILVLPEIQNDLGVIDICEEVLTEYFEITVDGVTATYPDPEMTIWDNGGSFTTYFAVSFSEEYFYNIDFPGNTVGSYDGEAKINEGLWDPSHEWGFLYDDTNPFTSFIVTEYGATGGYIKGTFEGVFLNSGVDPNVNANVSGSFSILITE